MSRLNISYLKSLYINLNIRLHIEINVLYLHCFPDKESFELPTFSLLVMGISYVDKNTFCQRNNKWLFNLDLIYTEMGYKRAS